MKTYCLATFVCLFAFCSLALSQSSHGPDKCCFNYFKTRIPAHNVERFETTNPGCKLPGVIFHTVKQLEICADPSEKWVQRLMGIVKNRMLDTTTTSGPVSV